MFTYRDLDAWKQAMDLVEQCYRLTLTFPATELYGLTSQIRRAAVSIPSNIAEGHCRKTTGAFANHVSIALGSHAELETCVSIASRLGFFRQADHRAAFELCDSVGRLLNGLYGALEDRLARDSETHTSPRAGTP